MTTDKQERCPEIDPMFRNCVCVCHKVGLLGLMCCPCSVKELGLLVNSARTKPSAPPQSIEILLDEWQESLPATATVGEWDYNDLIEFGRFVQAKSTSKAGGSAPEQDAADFYQNWVGSFALDDQRGVFEFAEAYSASTREPLEREIERLKEQNARLSADFQSWLAKYESGELDSAEIERLKAALVVFVEAKVTELEEYDTREDAQTSQYSRFWHKWIKEAALSDAAPPQPQKEKP